MNKHENAEIVVIGGGAVGTAVACYLARDGADVGLVERGEYAWGSSRRCDGHAVTYDSAPGYFSQFCKIGQDMFPEISRELPCDIEFEPEGLGDMVGVKVPIRPRQGQILVTERLDGLVSKNYAEFGYLAAKSGKKRPGVTPEMEQFGVAMVLEPSAAGTVLIGSSRRFVGMDTTPHPAVMQAIAQRAKHFFPSFSGVKLIRAYAGVRPASPDGKPIISPTHVEGVYVAAGHEGNGIGLSLITGKLVSQMLRGETPLVDLAPLCIDRFGMNPPSLPSA